MEWIVTFENQETRSFPIKFRSPQSLHQEMPKQKPALFHLKQNFEAFFTDEIDDFALFDWMIVSWKISIKQKYLPNETTIDSFQENQAQKKFQPIVDQTPKPILQFDILQNFDPFAGYQDRLASHEPPMTSNTKSWDISALFRPLYTFDTIEKISNISQYSCQTFLEESALSWWSKSQQMAYKSDFFISKNPLGQLVWLSKTPEEEWASHGIFA